MASWKNAACQQAHMAMPNAWFKEQGLYHPPQLETGQLTLAVVFFRHAAPQPVFAKPSSVYMRTVLAPTVGVMYGVLIFIKLLNRFFQSIQTTFSLQRVAGMEAYNFTGVGIGDQAQVSEPDTIPTPRVLSP